MNLRNIAFSLPLLFIGGCGEAHGDHGDNGGHSHDAVHAGGVLAELGDHVGQLEAALDSEKGTLTLWVWDGHLENTIRLTDPTLSVQVTVGEETFTLACAAQAKTLTGETVGDSSEFMGQDARLEGIEHADAHVPSITVKGVAYTDLEFHLD